MNSAVTGSKEFTTTLAPGNEYEYVTGQLGGSVTKEGTLYELLVSIVIVYS
jgi:hypothetical protein